MRPATPCKGCEKRVLGCHQTCEDYISFSTALKEEREKYSTWMSESYWRSRIKWSDPEYKKRMMDRKRKK